MMYLRLSAPALYCYVIAECLKRYLLAQARSLQESAYVISCSMHAISLGPALIVTSLYSKKPSSDHDLSPMGCSSAPRQLFQWVTGGSSCIE